MINQEDICSTGRVEESGEKERNVPLTDPSLRVLCPQDHASKRHEAVLTAKLLNKISHFPHPHGNNTDNCQYEYDMNSNS